MRVEDYKKSTLGSYPTPLEKMANLSKVLNKGNLYIKRDDTTGPAFGGNKTRKLEYIIEDALSNGYTALLTIGGPQTNHGRTTVAAAIKYGLKPILVLSGSSPDYLSGNLALDAMMGTDIVFDNGNQQEAIAAVIKRYEASGDKVYFLTTGGSDYIGTLGYINAIPEIIQQVKSMGINSKYLVCTFGSMGTFGGLNLGARYFNAPFKIIGIPSSPPTEDMHIRGSKFINDVSAHYSMGVSFTPEELLVFNGPEASPYSGQEYNKPDPVTREYMMMLAKTEGIILDPTYTGKTFRGFIDLLENDTIEPDSNPIFLHTGGAVAVWTKEHLDDMQAQLRDNCKISNYNL